MKQRITKKQLNGLHEKGKEGLRKWWKPKEGDFLFDFSDKTKDLVCGYGYYKDSKTFCCGTDPYEDHNGRHNLKDVLPLLSIGQMLEFLGGGSFEVWDGGATYGNTKPVMSGGIGYNVEKSGKNFCDLLWELVKEKLEK